MSISDAYVNVMCDNCGYEEAYQMTALAHYGSYDMRNIEAQIKRDGWLGDGTAHLCSGCAFDARLFEPDE